MNTPQFLITSYLNLTDNNLEELRKKLFEKGVLSKDYEDDGLILLYHKYDAPITNELERECRSLVIDRSTLKIKSYSCETPLINKEGMEYLLTNATEQQITNICYEGTYLSVFYHNDKWYVSTRRCLNSQESIYNPSENTNAKSHYDMFMDIITKAGYPSFNDFCGNLNINNSYYFVLIHHQNKHVIDYTSVFGEKYERICLTTVRDSEMREIDIYENPISFASYGSITNNSNIIFVPEKLDTIDDFATSNKNINYNLSPENEGVVVRIWNSKMNKYHLIKLQNINYQFSLVIGTERNMFKGLIYFYQNDRLIEYFNQNPNAQNLKKIINPYNTAESYDVVGMVDAVFKVCTSELFELFKILWSLKTGQHQNGDLYNILPKEYKDMLFAIRGLYFKKKSSFHTQDKEQFTALDIKNTHLKITDIYTYLKSVPTELLVVFIRMRRLMFNWARNESVTNTNLNEFSTISNKCDKIHYKLCAIFTNKLYPNIMPSDIPPQKDHEQTI